MPEPEASALIREGAELKNAITESEARLREINQRLAEIATFPEGKRTTKVDGAGLRAVIQKKIYIKLNQEKVAFARVQMGDHAFAQVFGWTFKPKSQRDLDGFLTHGKPEHVALVRDAMTITEGAPAVTFEKVEA
jgi:hypothetical protein